VRAAGGNVGAAGGGVGAMGGGGVGPASPGGVAPETGAEAGGGRRRASLRGRDWPDSRAASRSHGGD
jgi:hypothetical protein